MHWSCLGARSPRSEDDPDRDLQLSQPDFTLVNLPTTLRLPRYKSAFRVTHRFARPLGAGDFSELAEDLFGIDNGAQVGLDTASASCEARKSASTARATGPSNSSREYNALQQRDNGVLGLNVIGTIEGLDNFTESYSPAIGVVVSRELGSHGALYVEPIWVDNSNPLPSELVDDNGTFLIGLGARLRIRPTVYLVGEFIPRDRIRLLESRMDRSGSRSAPAATSSS